MTSKAYFEAALFDDWVKKYGMTGRVYKAILQYLQTENVGVDSGDTFVDNRWHFNRDIGEDETEAVLAYSGLLYEKWLEIDGYIADPNKVNCVKALKVVGMLSHAWQDYYAHAIDKNSDGSKGTIGKVTGNPDNPGDNTKPASWGGLWPPNFGEHGKSEPGERAFDYTNRKAEAVSFTKEQYTIFFDMWLEPCYCIAHEIIEK